MSRYKTNTAALSSYIAAQNIEGWPLTDKQKKPKADAATILAYSHLLDPVFFESFKTFQKLSKFINTYGEKFNCVNGRAYGSFNLCGTRTGRLSCDKSNLQNIPSRGDDGNRFRSFFKAPVGKKLVVLDYGQEELRILALEANEKKMLNAFSDGRDLHTLTASLVNKIPVEAVTKEQRALGKTLNFGLAYGAGASRFRESAKAAGIELSLNEAQTAKDAWLEAYPAIAKWQRSIKVRTPSTLEITTAGGRTRKFVENQMHYHNQKKVVNEFAAPYVGAFAPDYYSLTECYNTPIQGAGAEIMLEVMARLPDIVKKFNAKLVNIIHDEVVVEVDEDKASELLEAVKQVMIDGFLAIYPNVPLHGLVDGSICDNWGQK